ncbi:MAG: phosphotransferase [Oscillospiraceae bacterium]|nr:phosphotransferase [Oscillospiraceae bacterium]
MVSQNLLGFAAVNYDFDINSLEHIPRDSGKIMNKIYIFDKNNKKYIIKFDPPSVEHKNQLSETKAAMDFNYYLSENNISVAEPLKTIDGELVISKQDGGEEYIITAFAFLNGQTWGYNGSSNKMTFNWGKAMGDMHYAAKNYIPPNKYDVQKDIFDGYYWGSFFDNLKIYPTVYKIAQELFSEITVLPRYKDSFGIIHGDMHQGNFFTDGDKINIIDFGDSIYGWFALDIAISLCHALWWDRKDEKGNDYTNSIIENFIRGYLSANQLSDFWISKIPMFMKYRHLCMNPEKHGLGCKRDEWIYNIENDILFDGFELKSVLEIIKKAVTCEY